MGKCGFKPRSLPRGSMPPNHSAPLTLIIPFHRWENRGSERRVGLLRKEQSRALISACLIRHKARLSAQQEAGLPAPPGEHSIGVEAGWTHEGESAAKEAPGTLCATGGKHSRRLARESRSVRAWPSWRRRGELGFWKRAEFGWW